MARNAVTRVSGPVSSLAAGSMSAGPHRHGKHVMHFAPPRLWSLHVHAFAGPNHRTAIFVSSSSSSDLIISLSSSPESRLVRTRPAGDTLRLRDRQNSQSTAASSPAHAARALRPAPSPSSRAVQASDPPLPVTCGFEQLPHSSSSTPSCRAPRRRCSCSTRCWNWNKTNQQCHCGSDGETSDSDDARGQYQICPRSATRLLPTSPPSDRRSTPVQVPQPARKPEHRACTARPQAHSKHQTSHTMALLVLRAPAAVHAASRLLPPQPRRRRRLVAVASAASSAPSGEVSSQHGGGGGGYGIVGGPNGNAVVPATKSTVVETTVERVRDPLSV